MALQKLLKSQTNPECGHQLGPPSVLPLAMQVWFLSISNLHLDQYPTISHFDAIEHFPAEVATAMRERASHSPVIYS